jgi:hypothetical protein
MSEVYLCDSDQVDVWLSGEMSGDAATLAVEDTRDDHANVNWNDNWRE